MRCPARIFVVHSVARNSYIPSLSFGFTGVSWGAESVPSLNEMSSRPALLEPENFSFTWRSMALRSSSLGTPLLKESSMEGKRPFLMLLRWKVDTSRSSSM